MLASVGGNELKLYSVSRERELKLTNVVDGLHSYNLGAVAWNHTNQVVAIAGSEPKISLVQASDGQLLSTIPFSAEEAFEGPTRAIAFSNNSRYLASSSNRVVNLWDFKRRNLKASFTGHKGDVNAIAIAPEGDIVAGDSTGMLRIWDIKKGTSSKDLCVQTSSDQDPTKKTNSNVAVNCVQVSQFGAMRIASGYADGYLALWDYSTLQLLRSQRVHNGDVNALAFSPKNSRLVATTGMDGRVALVDTGSRTLSAPSAGESIFFFFLFCPFCGFLNSQFSLSRLCDDQTSGTLIAIYSMKIPHQRLICLRTRRSEFFFFFPVLVFIT